MNPIPSLSDSDLTRLVTHVTSTMLGMNFTLAAGTPSIPESLFRVAMLPIPGVPGILVALSSSKETCSTMAAKMFMTTEDQVDATMLNDALSELVNMTAGQIKNALGLDRALGLPRVLEADAPVTVTADSWRGVRMCSAHYELALWVTVPQAQLVAA